MVIKNRQQTKQCKITNIEVSGAVHLGSTVVILTTSAHFLVSKLTSFSSASCLDVCKRSDSEAERLNKPGAVKLSNECAFCRARTLSGELDGWRNKYYQVGRRIGEHINKT